MGLVVRPLKLGRGQEPQGGVTADAVVEHLRVLEARRPRLAAGGERLPGATSHFSRPKNDSTGALSQHWPRSLLLHTIPSEASARW